MLCGSFYSAWAIHGNVATYSATVPCKSPFSSQASSSRSFLQRCVAQVSRSTRQSRQMSISKLILTYAKDDQFLTYNLRLVHHDGPFLSQGSESRHDLLDPMILSCLGIQAHFAPLLLFHSIANRQVELSRSLTSPWDHIIQVDLNWFRPFSTSHGLCLFCNKFWILTLII